jgi:DNA-binding response OmpR family regulator
MSERIVRVLVVEDDASMAAGIVRGLKLAGFDVDLANDGAAGAKKALEEEFDIMVLDLFLPEQSGFDVLGQLDGRTKMPIIVLTASTGLDARLRSFDLGAADFVAKPFFMEELVARIKSRLGARQKAPKRIARWGGASVDLDARSAEVDGVAVELTKAEFDILAHLVERPGRAISRAQLAEHALDPFEERDSRTVDSHVARIRKKLRGAGSSIATVWGIGYRFVPAPDSLPPPPGMPAGGSS